MEVEEGSGLGNGLPVWNHSGLPDVYIAENATLREVAQKMSRWVDHARVASGRSPMFDRGAYTPRTTSTTRCAPRAARSSRTTWSPGGQDRF